MLPDLVLPSIYRLVVRGHWLVWEVGDGNMALVPATAAPTPHMAFEHGYSLEIDDAAGGIRRTSNLVRGLDH